MLNQKFVKILVFDGKHKLKDKWEDEPYLVIALTNADIYSSLKSPQGRW